jgi:alkylation response protein AidB-like acyl-CoA dehydrogenase
VSTPEATGAEALRREVAGWLAAEWDPARPREEFRAAVVEAGWAAPRWSPEWFGRGLPDELGHVVEEEFRRVGAPGSGQDRHNLFAATVLSFGSDDLKARLIGPMLRDEVQMCLLYSEPGAGSDLAAVRTRADRDGDGWVVTGQKVWTSGAKTADYGMLVARTNWDVPKHKGITFFVFPMKQHGVDVRPLHQITGESHFTEVFITDARVPDANRLGELDRGWGVLQTALAYERSVMGDQARTGRADAALAAGRGDALVALARETGRLDDPVLRQDLARVAALRRVNAWNNQRAKAELEQGSSSPVMSLGKLAMSRLLHEEARVRTGIAGARSMFEGPGEPVGDEANFLALNAYFTSIGGGTDQIQRNIIAERILGLPKEIEVDRELPFREVRRG